MHDKQKRKICVCQGKSCSPRGSERLLSALIERKAELEKKLNAEVAVHGCDCLGHCDYGPNVSVDGRVANGVNPANALDKIEEAINKPDTPIAIDIDKILGDL